VNYLTSEQFKDHFMFDGETIILSPNIAMIASLMGYDFDSSFEPYYPVLSASKQYMILL